MKWKNKYKLKRALLKPFYWLRWNRKNNLNQWLVKHGFRTLIDISVVIPKEYRDFVKQYPTTSLMSSIREGLKDTDTNVKPLFNWDEEKRNTMKDTEIIELSLLYEKLKNAKKSGYLKAYNRHLQAIKDLVITDKEVEYNRKQILFMNHLETNKWSLGDVYTTNESGKIIKVQ